MKLTLYYIFVFLICGFSSCSNRLETIGTIPSSPLVRIAYRDSLKSYIKDSVKLSNPAFSTYNIQLQLSDSDKYYNSLTYTFEMGTGKIVYRQDTLALKLLPFENDKCQVKFVPTGEGLVKMAFKATDQLNNSNTSVLELLVFRNLLPVSSFVVTPVKVIDPLEYLLDASRCYDPDLNFGGGIVEYDYQVDGQRIITSKNQIKHIFSAPGVYTVTLQTRDNDGGLSSVLSQQVSIN